MQRTNPDIDIILDILKAMQVIQPESVFINSLHQQYCERGSLSRKQLEGLHSKASKKEGIHQGKLATLQAIIMKKATRHRSEVNTIAEAPVNNEKAEKMISDILEKYPAHKRVLYFKLKTDKKELLSAPEQAELEKFSKLLTGIIKP